MLEVVKLLVIGSFVLALALLVLIALPKSKLREALMPFAYWGFALLCLVYVGSPVDLAPEIVFGPFGLIDDAGAAVAGIAAIRAALRSHGGKRAA